MPTTAEQFVLEKMKEKDPIKHRIFVGCSSYWTSEAQASLSAYNSQARGLSQFHGWTLPEQFIQWPGFYGEIWYVPCTRTVSSIVLQFRLGVVRDQNAI